MFAATRRQPAANSRAFLTTSRRSRPVARGLRLPIEFTHRMRFFRASPSMTCFLLRGSPSQSLQKQMMSRPSSIAPTSPFPVLLPCQRSHEFADASLDPRVDPLTYLGVLLDGVFDRAGRGGQGIQVAEQQHIARRAPEPLADAAGLQFLHDDDEGRGT